MVSSLLLQAIGVEGDVRKRDDVVRALESTIKSFGRLDILVNAAAGNFLVPAEDLSPNGFRTGLVLTLVPVVANNPVVKVNQNGIWSKGLFFSSFFL